MINPNPSPSLQAFETLFFNQQPWSVEKYDNDYFVENWREEENNYTLEKRRVIEGKNPQLIQAVFQPGSVIDLGCGPGNLMALLLEHGIQAEGIDGSPASVKIAPASVRHKIKVGSITKIDMPDNSYDLAICREVYEHLTIPQVVASVREMCRITRRYIYVTTRFHHNPQSLFDVETDFETDPTHITLLNKDMLRMLFVLEGMAHRPDLEEKMDWMKKGRCLVYEKKAIAL